MLAAARLIPRVARSWPGRAAVVDRSMAPALLPGDWILVDPDVRSLRPSDVVVAPDPDHPGETLVKRVAAVDGRAARLMSDAAGGRRYELPVASISGRAWLRYWPLGRVGRIGGAQSTRDASF